MQQQSPSLGQTLQRALEHHRAGDAAQASILYSEILKQQPYHPDARRLASLIGTGCSERHVRVLAPQSHVRSLQTIRLLLQPRNYVEIGVKSGNTLVSGCGTELLVGIDPEFHLQVPVSQSMKLFRTTSDEFFRRWDLSNELGGEPVDMAFIDGMHLFEFALRDFINIERYSSSTSVVFFHDVFPDVPEEADRDGAPLIQAGKPWRGDVYKIVFTLKRYRPDLVVIPVHDVQGGLLAVTNLDSSSKVLPLALGEILTGSAEKTFADVRLDLYDLFFSTGDDEFCDFLARALIGRRENIDVKTARAQVHSALSGAGFQGSRKSAPHPDRGEIPTDRDRHSTPNIIESNIVTLKSLGTRYGIAEATHGHCDFYEAAFTAMRARATKVLEMGGGHASLCMWRDWFPNATIHEIGPGVGPQSGITLHKLDRAQRDELEEFVRCQLHGTFDLIVDGASHLRDQQQALGILFRLVKPGGFFVIEDLQPPLCRDTDTQSGGRDCTLLMIERALEGHGWQSPYMSRQELDFLNQAVDLGRTELHASGSSQTCIIRRKASIAAAQPAAVLPGSVVIISYASTDELNQSRQQHHIAWARNWALESLARSDSGIVASDVVCFGPDSLDTEFTRRNQALLSEKRGGGYWLWKPFIIEAMLAATNAEFVVYCDSGSTITQSLDKVVGTFHSSGSSILAFDMTSCDRFEYQWTKGQVLRAMDATAPEFARSGQIGCTASAWRANDISRKLVNEWLVLMQNPAFATDAPSDDGPGDFPGFIEHRHDQSVFSLLIKKQMMSDNRKQPSVSIEDFRAWVGHHHVTKIVHQNGAGEASGDEIKYLTIFTNDPSDFASRYSLGTIAYTKNDFCAALEFFEGAKKLKPGFAPLWYNTGLTLARLGRIREALDNLNQALALDPGYEAARSILEVLSGNQKENTGAISADESPRAYSEKLGRALELQSQNRLEEAETVFRDILASSPSDIPSLCSLGVIEATRKKPEQALSFFERCLEVTPGYAPLWFNCGIVQQTLKQYEKALASYDRALVLDPEYKEVMVNRGTVLVEMKRHRDALLNYEELLKIDPLNDKALCNRGILLADFKLNDLAIQTFERLLQVSPQYEYALGLLCFEKLHACNWENLDALARLINEGVRAGKRVCKTLAFTAISNEPRDHLHCAEIFARQFYPPQEPMWRGEIYSHRRIRIAYLSPDFREHPVGHLLAGIFESHDRQKFEVIALSLGIDDRSSLRERMLAAFDRFIDARQMRSYDIAAFLREMEVDILVDLAGYTADSRTDILAFRPAPVQVNFLGYSSTMGAEYIDYIIADRHVIPEETRDCYSEKVVYMPDTYLPADSAVQIAETPAARENFGLPASGFVFCCFNHDYKINPPVFDVWMRLLKNIPGSVLWLMKLNESAERNLLREASARDVAPDRLVFATRVPRIEDHLARYRMADLYLDTTPCNAHSTTSDVLRSGLPVVTCRGKAFAGRVSAGLLSVVGLPELITETLEEYEALALKLARTDEWLREIRMKLQKNLETTHLFNSAHYCRTLERAYSMMWERYQCGQSPAHLLVEPAL